MTDVPVNIFDNAHIEDRVHPPSPLQFQIAFSLDQSIDDKEARIEDTFDHLGLSRRNLVDILYAVKTPLAQLMCPPAAHLHRYLIDYSEEIESEARFFFVLFSRRAFDRIYECTAGSDMLIDLIPDGADPSMSRRAPLTVELFPPTDLIDVFVRTFDQLQRQEERLQRLHQENLRLRNRIGLITEYLASQDRFAAQTFGLLLQDG